MNSKALKTIFLLPLTPLVFIFLICLGLLSCRDEPGKLSAFQVKEVQDSVSQMAERIARDVSRKGPVAWLDYFEDTPNFFMASEGNLVFPDHDSASNFIKKFLVTYISDIQLRWSATRIDPLTRKLANMAAHFQEKIRFSSGKQTEEEGYFTAVAERSSKGWQLRNAHWSIVGSK
jgi:hypothetical protein